MENEDSVPQKVSTESTTRIDDEGPPWFPKSYLKRSPGARQDYFENNHIQHHVRLEDVCNAVLAQLCSPGKRSKYRRRPTMVLLIGPARVGKSTAIKLIKKALLQRAKKRMKQDPGFIPVIVITLDAERSFDWRRYYLAVLEALGDPFLKARKRATEQELQEAMESALLHRKVEVIIIDEAQHLAKATRGATVQTQLDKLKYFQNRFGVSHVLAGTYEMQEFRRVNAQLALRSVDVHFGRYDATIEKELAVFQSVLWAFQRQMPLPIEPQLDQHWLFLYDRCLGCIGILKEHLNQALALALSEGVQTVTMDHLRRTSTPKAKLQVELTSIEENEKAFVRVEETDVKPWFLEKLGMLTAKPPKKPKEETPTEQPTTTGQQSAPAASKRAKNQPPGERNPERDVIGLPEEEQEDGESEKTEEAAV